MVLAFVLIGTVGMAIPVLIIVVIIRSTRSKAPGARLGPAPTVAQRRVLEARREALAPLLIRAEQALFGREDYPLRKALELVAAGRETLRQQLERLRAGAESVAAVEATLATLGPQVALLEQLLQGREISPEAKACRVGCYFCATPLLNEDVRRHVTLRDGAHQYPAIVCAECADALQRGEAPRMTVVNQGGSVAHWAEDAGFHPVERRHARRGLERVPFWKLSSPRPPGELAVAAAAGAAIAGAGLAAASVLDLGSLRQSAAASAASLASARASSSSRDRRSDRDHS